jgi:hypothetical protein
MTNTSIKLYLLGSTFDAIDLGQMHSDIPDVMALENLKGYRTGSV